MSKLDTFRTDPSVDSSYSDADEAAIALANATCKISEMKSIQPYSTRDEYIYAMKEDLAEWFNSMYATCLSALNFTEELENGVLVCSHANCVMKAAIAQSHKFNLVDLNLAGIINTSQLKLTSDSLQTPSSPVTRLG